MKQVIERDGELVRVEKSGDSYRVVTAELGMVVGPRLFFGLDGPTCEVYGLTLKDAKKARDQWHEFLVKQDKAGMSTYSRKKKNQ
jgi:hypothetical protein